MDAAELEELANEVRALAKMGEDELRLSPEIASAILGGDRVRISSPGTSACFDGTTIIVPEDHADPNFAIAHELGEWALRYLAKFKGSHVQRERAANYVAAAVLAPAPLVTRAHQFYGERLAALAETFALSQTSMALRLAEVRKDERAIVTRTGNVLVRTQGTFPWAAVPVVDVARGARWRGLAKTSLRGGIDEGRVALRAK